MEITIHEKKRAISHFTRNKKGRSRVTKIPFTILNNVNVIDLRFEFHLSVHVYSTARTPLPGR